MTPPGSDKVAARVRLAWVAGLAVVVVVLAAFVVGTQGDAAWGYDLAAYTSAAQRLAHGQPLYQEITQTGPFRPGPGGLYLYAPHLAALLMPIADLDATVRMAAWSAAHLAALVAACWLMPVRPSVRLAVLVVGGLGFPMLSDLVLGNVSTFVLLATALAWRWLGRPAGSWALAAGMTLRPTLGLVLLMWVLRREWRAVAWAIAAGVVLILVSLPLVGIDGWAGYATMLRNLTVDATIRVNSSLGAMAWRSGIGLAWAESFQLAGYVIALLAVLVAWRRDPEVAFVTAVAASLALAPLLWGHYLLSLLVPVALLLERGHRWAIALLAATWVPTLVSGSDVVYPIASLAVAVLVPLACREPAVPRASPAAA